MITAPIIVPNTVPTPPLRLAPPITQDAIAFISKEFPRVGSPVVVLLVKTNPAITAIILHNI